MKNYSRSKHYASGGKWSHPVIVPDAQDTGASTLEKIVHLVIDLSALAIIIGGILWVMSIV